MSYSDTMERQVSTDKPISKTFLVTSILLSTLIVGTDGDCTEPPVYDSAYVQRRVNVTVGSTVAYACVDGYQMYGPADNVVLVCSPEETWVGPEIDCTYKISCSPPFSPAYGSYNKTEEEFKYQSSVTFSCPEEYILTGPQSVVCTSSGQWLENGTLYTEPMCLRTCSSEEFRYLNHECYERMDSRGSWYYAKGNCETTGGQLATIKDSVRQSFVENLLRQESAFYWIGGQENDRDWKYPSDGQYANYFNWAPQEPNIPGENCVYLSNVHGPDHSLKWNDEYCSRSIIDTTPPIPIYCICETDGNCSALSSTYNTYHYKKRCLSFLNDTARDQPTSKAKCSNDLSGKLVEIKSADMQNFIEKIINDNNFDVANWWIGLEEGFDRTWSWVDGERITQFFWGVNEPSTPSENCLDILPILDFKWNDDDCNFIDRDHICQYGEARCGNPGAPYHGNLTSAKDSYTIGETIYFSCDDGYTLNDPLVESLTCQNDTNWSGAVPKCQKIICSEHPPMLPNSIDVSLSVEYRGITLYECLEGYLHNGYPVSVCQEDGTWSVPNATCTEISAPTEVNTEIATLETSMTPSSNQSSAPSVTITFTQDSTTRSKDIPTGANDFTTGTVSIKMTTHVSTVKTTDMEGTSGINSPKLDFTTAVPTRPPTTSPMTSHLGQSKQQSEQYSKQPVSTKEPSKGLIIGLSAAGGLFVLIVVLILLIILGVFEFPRSKSVDLPDNGAMATSTGNLYAATPSPKSETKQNGKGHEADSRNDVPQEVVFQMTDIKPLINSDC